MSGESKLISSHLDIFSQARFWKADSRQIRMGYACKPAKRGINVTGETVDVAAEMRGIVTRAMGEEGAKYRANIHSLSQAMRDEKAGAAFQVNRLFAAE